MSRLCLTQENADEFAIGSLPPATEAELAEHLRECEPCLEMVRASQRLAASLALAAPLAKPQPGLRRRTFVAAGVARPGLAGRLIRYGSAAAGVAAALIAIGAFTGMVTLRGQVRDLRQQNTDLGTQVDDLLSQKIEILALTRRLTDEERTSTELQQAARGDRDLLLAMLSPGADVAEVFSVEPNGSSIGRLVWDRDQKKVWFVASHLRSLSSGETYQIWASAGGKYHSLGTFNAEPSGFARYETIVPQGLESYESAVVTIERAGGAPERTGSSVFVADLSRLRH